MTTQPTSESLPAEQPCTDPRHTGRIREQLGCNGPDPVTEPPAGTPLTPEELAQAEALAATPEQSPHPEQCPVAPYAVVVVQPDPADPDELNLTASSHHMSPAAVAYGLRNAADAFDRQARAQGDEPIPYPDTEQAPAAPRVLTDDEYNDAAGAAISALGARNHNPGLNAVHAAVDAALSAIGIVGPPPALDPDTCPAQFVDTAGVWHQCGEPAGHTMEAAHDDGEWAWPDGARFATPEAAEEPPADAARRFAAEVEQLRARVAELEKRDAWLSALEAAGVDNWSGIEHAITLRGADEAQH